MNSPWKEISPNMAGRHHASLKIPDREANPSFSLSINQCSSHPLKEEKDCDPSLESWISAGPREATPVHLEETVAKKKASDAISEHSSISAAAAPLMSLTYLRDQKIKFTLIWLDMLSMMYVGAYLFCIIFISDFKPVAAYCLVALMLFNFVFMGILGLCHIKQYQDKIWLPLLMIELQYIGYFAFFSRKPEEVLDNLESPAKTIQEILNMFDCVIIIGFFENTFVIINSIQVIKELRNHIIMLCLILAVFELLIFITLDLPSSISENKLVSQGFIVFCFISVMVMDAVFGYTLYYFKQLQFTELNQELEENRKFKHMFNSIQDGVILLEAGEPKFVNSFALRIFGREADASFPEIIRDPAFYDFQQDGSERNPEPHSIVELLKLDLELLQSMIFTTSKTIAECTRMDQVAKIVEEESGARFYSIKTTSITNQDKAKKEVMVQIQDISLRVYSQNLRTERQYMALMNSTVSHEMRNPLNAMVSQTSQQQKLLTEFEALAEKIDSQVKAEATALISKSRHCLRVAQSSTKLLRFNVEDILALPQLKQGKFTKNVAPTDIRECVGEVLSIMQFQANEKKIRYDVEYIGFPLQLNNKVPLDSQRFQQVLLNYFSNSLKFTEVGGEVKVLVHHIGDSTTTAVFDNWKCQLQRIWREPSTHHEDSDISSVSSSEGSENNLHQSQLSSFNSEQQALLSEIFTYQASPKLVVSVIDTGIGITTSEQTRLFKLFGTIKRTRAVNTKGVGLGLSISKMIVEEFGGQVGVESKPGQGSAFVASFPWGKEEGFQTQFDQQLSSRIKEAILKQENAVNQTISKIKNEELDADSRILVVDDEAYNCEVLRTMMAALDIPKIDQRLKVCINGRQALKEVKASIESTPFKVILTDLSMPVMDGYQLTAKIRKLYQASKQPQPVIAALTGHTEAEFVQKAYQKGADIVHSKPISLEQVRQVLLQGGVHLKI